MVVLGVAVLSVFSLEGGAPSEAHAAAALQYRAGYSVQDGWLCYGWDNGTYHCTQHWSTANGQYVSGNSSWVPNVGSTSAAAPAAQTSTMAYDAPTNGGGAGSAPSNIQPAPAGISQWASTGIPSQAEPYGTFQGYSWGYCTSGAALLAHDNVANLGNAEDWTRNAAARGMATGTTPQVGATVIFQPNVQGAGGLGHAAHVVAVYSGGWFEVEDTDFVFAGGGFGRLSFRYAHSGAGVSFIY